jgi:CRISPR system Cascade subunit CasA
MPNTSFNLIDQPWIPVNMMSGAAAEVSIRQAFTEARTIRSIEGDNPFQTAAISRLLLAILYRAVTPLYISQKDDVESPDVEFWSLLWNDNGGDVLGIVNEYLDEYTSRFDLFDKQRPFFQIPNLEYANDQEGKSSIGRIMPDQDKIAVFRKSDFDGRLTYAEAARVLVTYQSWSTTTILSPVIGMYEDMNLIPRVYQGGRKGWCGSIGLTMMNGRNLYETLVLNTLPSQFDARDIPFWEERTVRKVPVMFEKNADGRVVRNDEKWDVRGQVQLFVWFSKSVRLIEEDGMVVGAVASEYDSLPKAHLLPAARLRETQTGWRESAHGEVAAWHFFDDAAWSNLPTLTPATRDGFVPPKNVVWAAKVTNLLGITVPARVRIIGAQADDKWQTFRGVIDRTVDTRSLAILDDEKRLARLNDAADSMIAMVQKMYFGFARDCSRARFGIVETDYARSLMINAYSVLDREVDALYTEMTDAAANPDEVAERLLARCAEQLLAVSLDYAASVQPSELMGRWVTENGVRKLASVAAARSKLARRLRKYAVDTELDLDDDAGYVSWAIKKNVKPSTTDDLLDSAIAVWSTHKRLHDGSSTHREVGHFGFMNALDSDNGKVFGGFAEKMVNVQTHEDAMSVIRSVVGTLSSYGLPADFGLLAAASRELVEGDGRRVAVAQKLLAHLPH